ncbi:MAG: S8 family serine peptidase [Deltaproteobacteria bacterium]|nr:S8 family serine peptidase [Deltaproteobacteria bacterium]
MDPNLWGIVAGDRDDEVAALIRLAPGAAPPPGVRIVTRFGEVATCRLARGAILAVRDHPAVRSLKAARALVPEPAAATLPRHRTRAGRGAAPWTGRGSLVGVIDWGCDVGHPNFLDERGRTRLVALWDQRPSRRRPPEPYGYGVVHDRRAIDRALASGDPFAALAYDPADVDVDDHGTHGTHVVDIAAGRPVCGAGGVAPGADLAFVHLAMHERGPRNIASSVTLLEAIDFIANAAGGRPWVINLSLGSHAGPHDGSTLVELALDACVDAGPGRVIVQSVGNYFRRPIHATGVLEVGVRTTLAWLVDPTDETPNELDLWYGGSDRAIVYLFSPSGRRVVAAAPDSHGALVYDGAVIGRFGHRTADPNNGDNQVTLIVDPVVGGRWRVVIEPIRVERGDFHVWVERDEATPGSQSRLARSQISQQTTTNSISNGHRTITVGGYDRRTGEIARFSSAGPTRDGRQKPDLLAPGVAITAARSAGRDGGGPELTVKSGTSMAAPHVTGTIALLYEAAGRALSIDEVRDILERTCARMRDPRAGWGRLDIAAATAAARSLQRPEA